MSPTSPRSPTSGVAMNWIADHAMTHPKSYETAPTLPLRTIFALNSQTSYKSHNDFQTTLLEHLQSMPCQPCNLPPVFLTSYISKTFPKEYEDVDFDQALTALDYIRDLQIRWTKEFHRAVRARGVHDQKIIALKTRLMKLDHVYAKALVGIRRWTLIAELSMPRLNKCNCVALLNTLYPIEEEGINSFLTASLLQQHRHALWKYITAVEKSGPAVLESVKRANGGWEEVSKAVEMYCSMSLEMIQKAEDLARPTSIGSFQSDATDIEPTTPKSPLSPVSFSRRDSTNDSSEGEYEGTTKRSTLEKIVRGLAKLSGSSHKKVYSTEWNGSDDDVKMHDSSVA